MLTERTRSHATCYRYFGPRPLIEDDSFLLDHRAPVDAITARGETALMLASGRGHDAIVEMLIRADADVNGRDQDGLTPLMIGAREGHEQVVTLLLKNGADATREDDYGKTAIDHALSRGHAQLAVKLGWRPER